MVLREVMEYPAFNEERERRVYVYLPQGYDENQEKRYPVLYMFDGHNLFWDGDATYGKSWGLEKYLDEHGTQLIVVGVECNKGIDNARLSEYAPYTFDDPFMFGHIKGRGNATLEWFINILKPEIDRCFRTKKNRQNTFIGGSSMGGLMALYAVLKYHRSFSRCIALSPSIWACFGELNNLLKKEKLPADTMVYMDYGSRELGDLRDIRIKYGKMSAALMEKGVFVTSRIVPNGNHSEHSWERQLPFAIEAVMYDIE